MHADICVGRALHCTGGYPLPPGGGGHPMPFFPYMCACIGAVEEGRKEGRKEYIQKHPQDIEGFEASRYSQEASRGMPNHQRACNSVPYMPYAPYTVILGSCFTENASDLCNAYARWVTVVS